MNHTFSEDSDQLISDFTEATIIQALEAAKWSAKVAGKQAVLERAQAGHDSWLEAKLRDSSMFDYSSASSVSSHMHQESLHGPQLPV